MYKKIIETTKLFEEKFGRLRIFFLEQSLSYLTLHYIYTSKAIHQPRVSSVNPSLTKEFPSKGS